MKTKSSLLATAATMALFASANAATFNPATFVEGPGTQTIDITGSSAGRSTVHTAIIAQLGGAANVAVRFYRADGSTVAAGSADAAIYKGTFNSAPVIVRTFWAGSASGVDSVSNQGASANPLTNRFIAISQITSAANNTSSQVSVGTPIGGAFVQAAAELAEFGYSDVKQASTIYQTTPLASENNMFVIPFAMYRTETLTGVTNVTNQQLRGIYTGGGTAPRSLFTGVTGDSALVYTTGRDNDSGTRITFAAETGTGVFTGLNQFQFTVAGSGTTATISNPVADTPTGGYASGSSERVILGATGLNVIGYLGLGDGSVSSGNAVSLGAVQLTFNGVAFSQAAVRNGSYTFWSYYQSLMSADTLADPNDANAVALHGALETAFSNIVSSDTAIDLDDMAVGRQADGSTIEF